ncbi:hypothetical protein EIP91_007727 [Steccherinum ochraceum]|uniref:Uncharacterized protein n=1 Tax=Steccherinum ochraceum TaxID=92696 RepID=A0A4R0R6I6_9APHY|nr:hypothetical protein EIP91_007727 [Steccherinum ochraceum]
MPPLHIVVVGGSIAGLMSAIVLKRLGHDVTIYEQIPAALLQDRGAGMGMFAETIAFLAKYDLTHTEAGCKSSYRWWMDKEGREIARMDMPSDRTTSWDLLSAILRANFDGLSTAHVPNPPTNDEKGQYIHGVRVDRVEEKGELGGLNVYLKDEEGKESIREADMVICADGAGGTLRKELLGGGEDAERKYAGYVAWRGTVPESKLSPKTKRLVSECVPFHHQKHNQALGYTIPGPTGSIQPGERRMNWLWYTNIEQGSARWEEVMTDINGVLRTYTMPHGKVRPEVWRNQVEEGRKTLPAVFAELMEKTEVPFIQAITDNFSNKVVFFEGRVLLVGDAAAGFRPHIAASTSQSAIQAMLLDSLMRRSNGVLGQAEAKQYEEKALAYANEVSKKGIQMGSLSQFGEHPMQRSSRDPVASRPSDVP